MQFLQRTKPRLHAEDISVQIESFQILTGMQRWCQKPSLENEDPLGKWQEKSL